VLARKVLQEIRVPRHGGDYRTAVAIAATTGACSGSRPRVDSPVDELAVALEMGDARRA
jgi:hypothetical protein